MLMIAFLQHFLQKQKTGVSLFVMNMKGIKPKKNTK